MKTIFISPSGMKATGAGPAIVRRALPFILAAILLEVFFSKQIEIPFLNDPVLMKIGFIWLFAGLVMYIGAIIQFSINFPKNKLITNGMYAFSRNPIYSAMGVFILPSLAILFNNLMFLLAAIAMCMATLYLVKQEEEQLTRIFGETYLAYRRRVKCLLGISLTGLKLP